MATGLLNKLIRNYLVLSGIAAHLVVLGALLLAPDLVQKARHKVQTAVSARLSPMLPSAAAAAPSDWEEARASLRRWTPRSGEALAPGQIRVDGRDMPSLRQAAKQLHDGSVLEVGPGTYTTPLVIRVNGLRLIGRGHVVFDGVAAEGKGTLVVKGNDTVIENIECRNVKVRDGNGACVRLEGRNLRLEHVYFHSAQEGLLTGRRPGDVVIHDSFFERLGHRGQAHAIYQGGGTLTIDRSYILASKSQGHEVKSRAQRTTITRSVIASLNGRDSRLIDISVGGVVSIADSTLQQGPESANLDVIGFALEKGHHRENALTIERCVIIMERRGANLLLRSRAAGMTPVVRDNIIVAPQPTDFAASNLEYRSREEAGLPRFPEVPDRPT